MKLTKQQTEALAAKILQDVQRDFKEFEKKHKKALEKAAKLTKAEEKEIKTLISLKNKYNSLRYISDFKQAVESVGRDRYSKALEDLAKANKVREGNNWDDSIQIQQCITLATIDSNDLVELATNALELLKEK